MAHEDSQRSMTRSSDVESADVAVYPSRSDNARAVFIPVMRQGFGWRCRSEILLKVVRAQALWGRVQRNGEGEMVRG